MAVVRVDEKGRIQLSKQLRKETGVERNDHLIVKSLSRGKILLEKPEKDFKSGNDQLEWLFTHPASIQSSKLKAEIKKMRSTKDLIENWKEQLWMGE